MSTGDQTQYVRSKIAERGSERGEHFMMDGFDRWAESSAPARAGQMEKTPAESQMESYGGAMTLSKAKRLQSMMSKHGGAMGGASVNVGGIQIPIPDYIDQGIKAARDLIKVVEWTINFVDEFAEDLTDNVINQPQDYAPAIIEDCKELITVLNSLKPYMDSVRYMLDLAKSLGLTGSGKGRKMVGGDWAATFQAAQQTAQAIIDWYLWLKQKAATIRVVLKLQSVQKVGGQQLLDYLEPIFGAVGFGRRGGRGPKHCCCDDSGSEYSGSALPVLDLSAPRKVGGRGSMKKLKSLLMPGHIPRLPPIPKFVGGNRGREPRALVHLAGGMAKIGYEPSGPRPIGPRPIGGRKGGMTVTEKMQLLSPKEKALLELPTGRRKGGASYGGKKPSARGAIVKKVMREQGLSLPQASKYVKEHGLY